MQGWKVFSTMMHVFARPDCAFRWLIEAEPLLGRQTFCPRVTPTFLILDWATVPTASVPLNTPCCFFVFHAVIFLGGQNIAVQI